MHFRNANEMHWEKAWCQLRAVLNKSWKQHSTKQKLCGHLLPISQHLQIRQTRHAGHCWRSRGVLIIDVLLWTPTRGRASVGRTPKSCIHQLCADTGRSLRRSVKRDGWLGWMARENLGTQYPQCDLMMMMMRMFGKKLFYQRA